MHKKSKKSKRNLSNRLYRWEWKSRRRRKSKESRRIQRIRQSRKRESQWRLFRLNQSLHFKQKRQEWKNQILNHFEIRKTIERIRTNIWKTSSLFIRRTINHKKQWKKIRSNTRIMCIVFSSDRISEKMSKNDTSIWARSWKAIKKLFEHRSKLNSKWKRTRKSTNIYCCREWSF